MQSLTKNFKNLNATDVARGGFGRLHKAFLCLDNSQIDQIEVVVKFPVVHKIVEGNDAESSIMRSRMAQRWRREIRAGQSVQHPNILPFLGFCDNPDPAYQEFVGLVLPFCENGNGFSYVCKHDNVDRLRILVQTGAALFALHSASPPVVHGDIKGANILINDNGHAYLADFGLSRICETKGFTTQSVMGTYRWTAVELLHAIAYDRPMRTSTASDVWAFAMTVLEILSGRVPFAEMGNDGAVFLKVVTEQALPEKPRNGSINDVIWTLLKSCWQEDPASRPDARHACLALDIIYGNKYKQLEPFVMVGLLNGTWDNVGRQTHQHRGPLAPPYKCKWLNCSYAFDRIDDCIAHECAEFASRRKSLSA